MIKDAQLARRMGILLALLCVLAAREAHADDLPTPTKDVAEETAARSHLDGAALELAGLRELPTVVLTSDPPQARVLVDGAKSCYTPCRLTLPPGRHHLVFIHRDMTSLELESRVSGDELLQLHARFGRAVPWKVVLPLSVVGAVFLGGGISSLVLYGDDDPTAVGESDLPADERRFHRNLGITGVAIGLPLFVLAGYLLFTGERGEVRSSVAPSKHDLGLAPLPALAPDAPAPIGAAISGRF